MTRRFVQVGSYFRAALAACALTLAGTAHAGDTWVRTWSAPPVEAFAAKAGDKYVGTADVTFRMLVRVSAGGQSLRLRLSNELNERPLALGAVRVAVADASGRAIAGTDRVVRFGGIAAPTIPPLAPIVSDPVALSVPALTKLVVSIHVPGEIAGLTMHPLGAETATIADGDQTDARELRGGRTTTQRYILSGIDVAGGTARATIVAFGDSITDGALSTDGRDRRWPDILAERLARSGNGRFAIANAGISGNRLLQTGAGPAALARLDRDVLSVPGVSHLILLEGINDIGFSKNARIAPPRPDDLIAAYRQIVARAHQSGIKVYGATILPYFGTGYSSPEGEAVRVAVNAWIRRAGSFDGVIDFDRAMSDPANHRTLNKRYDSGDRLHPNDAGYAAMAAAIDLRLFR